MTKFKLLSTVSVLACGLGFGTAAWAENGNTNTADNGSQAAQDTGLNVAVAGNVGGQTAGTNAADYGSQSGDGGNTLDNSKTYTDNSTYNKDDNSTYTTTLTYNKDDNSTFNHSHDDNSMHSHDDNSIYNKDDNSTYTKTTDNSAHNDAAGGSNIAHDDAKIKNEASADHGASAANNNSTSSVDNSDHSNESEAGVSWSKGSAAANGGSTANVDNSETDNSTYHKEDNSTYVHSHDDNSVDNSVDNSWYNSGTILTVGDIALNNTNLQSTVSGNSFVGSVRRSDSSTVTTGNVDNTSVQNARGINQLNLNTGVASQNNTVSISANVSMPNGNGGGATQ